MQSAAIIFLLGIQGTEATAEDRLSGELRGKNTHPLVFLDTIYGHFVCLFVYYPNAVPMTSETNW